MNTQDKNGTYTPQACTSDADCACWDCLSELTAERERNGWKAEWFGIPATVLPIMRGRLAFCNGGAVS